MLGGDGTILTALREFAGTDVPVFAINFGEVGFLATLDPDGLAEDFDRAFAGEFERLTLPTIHVGRPGRHLDRDQRHLRPPQAGHARRRPRLRRSRARRSAACAATASWSPRPQGSTGYNLANGGPVLAWGVRGFVVSFIAPHSLTARALVVAPDDLLTINNASREEPVEVHVDGRPACELPAGEDIHVEFGLSHATLAQLPGASFYHRLRERFGRLGEVAAARVTLGRRCTSGPSATEPARERARSRSRLRPGRTARCSRSHAVRATPASSGRSSPGRPRWGRLEALRHGRRPAERDRRPRGRSRRTRRRSTSGRCKFLEVAGYDQFQAVFRGLEQRGGFTRLLSWLPFAEGVNWKRIKLAMLAWKDRNRSSRAAFEIAHRKEIAELGRARPRGVRRLAGHGERRRHADEGDQGLPVALPDRAGPA